MGRCTAKLEDASKPSFSFPPSKEKKMTALVDEFLENRCSIHRRRRVAKRRQGKIEKEAQD
jgi:hypothetical protein